MLTSLARSSKGKQIEANIISAQKLSEDKAILRQREASIAGSLAASKKRVASTEEPRGSEKKRHDRTRRQRFKILAERCKLEEEMKRLDRELAIIGKDDSLLELLPPRLLG